MGDGGEGPVSDPQLYDWGRVNGFAVFKQVMN